MNSGLRVLSVGSGAKTSTDGTQSRMWAYEGLLATRNCENMGEKVQGMELMSLLRAWELLGHDNRSRRPRDGGEHKRYSHGERAQGSG